jgi:RHS repeat-associated protein
LTSRKIHGGTVGTTWTYDTNANDRRLLGIANNGAARSFEYTTTPEALITQVVESAVAGSAAAGQPSNYSYDDADRLLKGSASGGAQYLYGYDPADNIVSATGPGTTNIGTYNSLNQVKIFNGQAFVYDANGNLTDDGVRSYKWDAEDRLVSVSLKSQPSRTTTFIYDGLGRRVVIAVATGTSTSTTQYLWCGQSLCQARIGNSTVSRHYYPEGESVPGSGSMIYAQDHLGSVTDALDGSTGNRVAFYEYEPYGNPTPDAGQASTDFRYAGLFYEQNTGLYLALHRVYDPRTGRWLSRDPLFGNSAIHPYLLGLDGSVGFYSPAEYLERGPENLCSYGGGNPVNRVDSSGLSRDRRTQTLLGALGVVTGIGAIVFAAPVEGAALTVGFGIAIGIAGPSAIAFGVTQIIGAQVGAQVPGGITDVLLSEVAHSSSPVVHGVGNSMVDALTLNPAEDLGGAISSFGQLILSIMDQHALDSDRSMSGASCAVRRR